MIKSRSKKWAALLLIFAAAALSFGFQGKGSGRSKTPEQFVTGFDRPIRTSHPSQPDYSPSEILVKFKVPVSDQRATMMIAAYGAKEIRKLSRINVHKVQIPKGMTVEQTIFLLQQNPYVEYVEPNYKTRLCVTPNDTLFKYQYALYNKGQAIGDPPGSPQGKERADIKATSAWEVTQGDASTVIAVIDTGIDFNHPDLKNKIMSRGRDFVNDDYDAADDHGHGTHVAGIAAAETNNDEGIAGVAWNCKILPVKTIDKDASGFYDWLIDGITWAADQGAAVINLSVGGDEPSTSLKSAMKYAYDKNAVIVAAAGNEDGDVLYPAAYDDYVLAVAATDYTDSRTTWSNHGPQIDVAAPGVRIWSSVPTWYVKEGLMPYMYLSGTSMAAPHVAGLAALLKSHKPWLKTSEIMDIIRYSADDVNAISYPGRDDFIGYGRINMEKALAPIKITK